MRLLFKVDIITNNEVFFSFRSHFLLSKKNILTSSADLVHSGGTVYTVEQENCEDPEQESGFPRMQQSLLLFLFLQHSDPFICQLSDIMGERQLHV